MDGWNTSFLLGWPIFRCYVSFREGILLKFKGQSVMRYQKVQVKMIMIVVMLEQDIITLKLFHNMFGAERQSIPSRIFLWIGWSNPFQGRKRGGRRLNDSLMLLKSSQKSLSPLLGYMTLILCTRYFMIFNSYHYTLHMSYANLFYLDPS